jgi:hypothetical protein
MTNRTYNDITAAIARDLELCDLGVAITKGAVKRKYVAHKKACLAAIKEMNIADGRNDMTDDELLAELFR